MASYGGQNYGKGDYHRLEKGVRSALLISVIYSLLAAAAVGLFLRPLLSLFFSGDIDIASLMPLSLIHISEPTRLGMISYAVFCLKKKKNLSLIHIS